MDVPLQYLKDGRQTLEYGKNYDGYWTGELVIKQVCSSFSQLVKHFVNDNYSVSSTRN
jgi:hypothetical protein